MADGLTARRIAILHRVVEAHIETGQPVGSRALAELGEFASKASTIRSELHWLEEAGLLDHPHTSAGRVPTEAGYRRYADHLIDERGETRPLPVELAASRGEVDAALRATTEALAQVSSLLALVSAPPLSTTQIVHVEVLQLQPQVLMVVVITGDGTVAKRIFVFERAIDAGLAQWARAYLNEQVAGVAVGTHALRRRLEDETLGVREREFLGTIAPVFTELLDERPETVYVGGASRLISQLQAERVEDLGRVAEMLEERATMLRLVRDTIGADGVLVRLGGDHDEPGLRALAVVAAGYGVGARRLGAVSLVGPIRMDYAGAIAAVRGAAAALSEFAEDVYQ